MFFHCDRLFAMFFFMTPFYGMYPINNRPLFALQNHIAAPSQGQGQGQGQEPSQVKFLPLVFYFFLFWLTA